MLAEFQGQHVSRMFVNDANTSSNPAYDVFDVRLEVDRGVVGVRLAPFIAVQNLFDKRYNGSVVVNAAGSRYFEPAPGRNLLVGLRLPTTRWPY
jgi:iron complex outermembrane receptor protein